MKDIRRIFEGEIYFAYTDHTSKFGKYAVCIDGQWFNSQKPFKMFEYMSDEELNPADYQGERLQGQILVKVREGENGEYYIPVAIQLTEGVEDSDSNPFITFED